MEPKPFLDPTESLHRRVGNVADGEPNFKQVFRWAKEHREDGISVDRGSITGDNPRQYWQEKHKSQLCATFSVADLDVKTAAEHGVTFPLVHKPENATEQRPENPAHSEIEVHLKGVKQSNPGAKRELREAISLFKTHMKSLHDSGRMQIHGASEQETTVSSDQN